MASDFQGGSSGGFRLQAEDRSLTEFRIDGPGFAATRMPLACRRHPRRTAFLPAEAGSHRSEI